jgi:hypothetical protein
MRYALRNKPKEKTLIRPEFLHRPSPLAQMLHFSSISKRLCPEVVLFLSRALRAGFGAVTGRARPFTFFPGSDIWASATAPAEKPAAKARAGKKAAGPSSIDIFACLLAATGGPKQHPSNAAAAFAAPEFQAAALRTTLSLLRSASEQYSMSPSYPELFADALEVVVEIDERVAAAFPALEALYDDTLDVMTQSLERHLKTRVPLVLDVPPPMIKQFNPSVVENYVPGKDHDHEKERSENKRLAQKVKKEKKGAIKELRRDTVFLAAEKRNQIADKAQERNAERNRVKAMMEESQRDSNIFAKISAKKKKKGK